jgi:hypothetical protein
MVNIILQKKIAPRKLTNRITKSNIEYFVSTIKEIKFHSIKNLAVNGKPENNNIKNQRCLVIFGNKRCKPFIYIKALVLNLRCNISTI